jgi:hypothetical protein
MFEELGYHHSTQIPLLSDTHSVWVHVAITNPPTSSEHIPTTRRVIGLSTQDCQMRDRQTLLVARPQILHM